MPFPNGDWSSTDVCKFLGISRWTLYRLIKSGRLRPTKQGRRWYFNPEMVKAYRAMCELPRGRVFLADEILKYYWASGKYQVIRKPRSIYWLRLRSDYLSRLDPARREKEDFGRVKFHIRRFSGFGGTIRLIVIHPKYFARLPAELQQQWLNNEFIL